MVRSGNPTILWNEARAYLDVNMRTGNIGQLWDRQQVKSNVQGFCWQIMDFRKFRWPIVPFKYTVCIVLGRWVSQCTDSSNTNNKFFKLGCSWSYRSAYQLTHGLMISVKYIKTKITLRIIYCISLIDLNL